MLRFGLILPNFGPLADRATILETGRLADELGFHSIWTTDHVLLPRGQYVAFEHIFEALITLAYLAEVAPRVELGISTLVLPQRDPVLVAKQVASLDALSGGRVIFSGGVGWAAGEYQNLGQDFHNRGRRMDEALQVMRSLWDDDDPHTFRGRYYQFEEGMFSPRPARRIPLWIAGNSPAAKRRALTYADGWHPTRLDLAGFQAACADLRQLDPDHQLTISLRTHADFDGEAQLSGEPSAMIDNLQAFAQAGLAYPIVGFPTRSRAAHHQAMERFAAKIMPEFAQD